MAYSNDEIKHSITKKLNYAIVHHNIWLTWVKRDKKMGKLKWFLVCL